MIAKYESLYPRLLADAPDGGDAAIAGARRFHHLIGLVPDPSATERSDAFDSALEGLGEAVAHGMPVDGGTSAVPYVRDHYWLPWSGNDKRAKRCWLRHPGVVLYRPLGDPRAHPAFLVLLVGETPTWGVRKDQLAAAIELVVRQHALEDSDAGAELRIVGPTFSGTAPSLAAVLREHPADGGPDAAWPAHVSMVSGTATNPGIGQLLRDLGDGGTTATYATTTPSDADLLAAMWAFLQARGARGPHDEPLGNAIVLSESVTAYGEGVAAQRHGDCGPTSPCFEERAFPLDLTSLREAEGEGDGGTTPAPATHATELSEDTPYVHGLELGEVLRELSSNETRFVGLVATDPRDVLFLAQRIRNELPDVRLFTLASDIRYLDSSHAQALDGMLVAHAAKGAAHSASIALTNETVRTTFLAARSVLGDGQEPAHVEISLIGNGGLWEIGPDKGAPGDWNDPRPRPRPLSWKFVLAFMWILFAIVLGAIVSPWVADRLNSFDGIRDLKTTGFLRHRGSLWTHIGRCAHLDLRADDGLVTAAMLVITACPLLLMMGSTWAGGTFWAPLPILSCLTASALVWTVLAQARSRIRVASAARAMTNWSAIILSAAAVVAGLLGVTLAFSPARETTYNLLSGGSPVLVGILGFVSMGIGLWCWRVRLRFLDSHRFGMSESPETEPAGRAPTAQAATPNRLFADMAPPIAQALGEDASRTDHDTGIDEIERRLLKVIRTPWTTFSVVPVAVHLLLAATVAVPVWIKPPQTLEPQPWSSVLVVFGILALLPVTGNLSRLLATWILFRRLLRRIASRPCVEALGRLPPPLARNLTAQLAVSGGDVSDLAYALESLGRLVAIAPEEYFADYERCRTVAAKELRCAAGADGADTKTGDAKIESASTAGAVVDALLAASSKANRNRDGDETRTRAIDDLTATLVAVFVPRYVRHFRLFMPLVIFGSILSVAMTSLYFIQPERLITSLIFVWVAAVVLAGFVIYTDLDRDPVLSAIGKTTAGSVHFDWGLVTRTLSWGLLPLASLVASQYPALGSLVSSLFDSVAKAFR